MAGGIGIQTGRFNADRAILILLPAQFQFLPFPGFGNIANGQIRQPVLPVELAAKVVGRYQQEAKTEDPMESAYLSKAEHLD